MDCADKKKQEVLYPNLTSLDLSHNEIVNLPSEICELVQLAELKISYNKIKEVTITDLTEAKLGLCPVCFRTYTFTTYNSRL